MYWLTTWVYLVLHSLLTTVEHKARGVTTYTQKRICVHIWIKNMGSFYHNSDGFLMLCVQKVCIEPILISLNPILTEFVMMLVSPPHRHPLMICHQFMESEWGPDHIYFIIHHYQANTMNPDQTAPKGAVWSGVDIVCIIGNLRNISRGESRLQLSI